jgi:lipoprotein NlpD
MARAQRLFLLILLAASACGAPLRSALRAPAKHRDGAHQHAFASALRTNDAPPSLGRVAPYIYVVRSGDTLYSLARTHGVTVGELASLNGLAKPEDLQAGTRLRLPERRTAPLETAASKSGAARHAVGVAAVAKAAAASVPQAGKTTSSYMLRWPVSGAMTSRFGRRSGHVHDGIDIGAPKGTEVMAAADGDVVFADTHGGYGNVVILRHASGLLTIYAHHERNLVRKGQRVHAGDTIARVGTTGRSSGPHLHFEVRTGTRPTNPLSYLPP